MNLAICENNNGHEEKGFVGSSKHSRKAHAMPVPTSPKKDRFTGAANEVAATDKAVGPLARHDSTNGTEIEGAVVFRQACKMGLEGTVSKRLSAPYRSGPSQDCIKVKNPESPAMRRARAGMW
jgi:hypothetical protein